MQAPLAGFAAQGRNAGLDGLRGYAAIAVIIFHSILLLIPGGIETVLRGRWSDLGAYGSAVKAVLKVVDGEMAVMLFFVLSGAVLFRSLMREEGPFGALAFRFYVRRVFRIYPAMLVCVIAGWLAFTAAGKTVTAGDVVRNLTLYDATIIGPTWTLNVEMIAPVFLLLSYLAFRAGREWGLAAAAFGLVLLLRLPQLDGYLIYFKSYWYCFALGAFVPTRAGRALAPLLPRWSWIAAMVCAVVLRWPLREVAIAILVASVYYGRAAALGGFLTAPVSQFLGRISYSLYLFNVPFVVLIGEHMQRNAWASAHPLEAGLGVAAVVIALTIPVAWLSWALIEMPFNRLGHRLTGRAD